jgi:hypothetical protein
MSNWAATMSKHKSTLRGAALHSLNWARKFRESGDGEYYAKALKSFRMWRAESKEAA